jgi:transposase
MDRSRSTTTTPSAPSATSSPDGNAWLFVGNDEGGRRTAILSTLVYSCKLLKIDPVVYLTDVLERLTTHPGSAVEELTPRRWLAARQAAARTS